MQYQPFLIQPFTKGVNTQTQRDLLSPDAFQSILNGYIHHGVINKRSGMQLMQWFVNASTTTITSIIEDDPGVVTLASSVGVSNGDRFQIRNATGMSFINNITFVVSGLSGTSFNLTDIYGNNIDTSTYGSYTGSGEYFPVPEEPIMGIYQFIDDSGSLVLVIFNTKRGCVFDTGSEIFTPLDTSDILNGTNSNFVSFANYGRTNSFSTSTLFLTNYIGGTTNISPIRIYTSGSTTSSFVPNINPTGTATYVTGAQFIFSIRQRLLLLNTLEGTTYPSGTPLTSTGNTQYPQRMRWSRINNPSASVNNWDQVTPGNGGFVDAPTSEYIISAKFIQDTIIVYFTFSVWSIEPTSDPALPFRWKKLNSIRACDAPYATIEYDRYSVSFGKRGIQACDRIQVSEIDEEIQDFMFNEVNAQQYNKMYSHRNFNSKKSFTLYPSCTKNLNPENESTTSNYALIRTEDESAWFFYSVYNTDIDSENGTNMSCLGSGKSFRDFSFESFAAGTNYDFSYEDFSTETWDSFTTNLNTEVFLGGDQIGRILLLETDGDDLGKEIEFNLVSAAWNPYKNEGKEAQLGYIDFYVDADVNTKFTVNFYKNDSNNPYASANLDCLPELGFIADIQYISNDNPCKVTAYSHGLSTGDIIYIYNVDGMTSIIGGHYTITVIDENNITLDGIDATSYDAYISSGQIVEKEFYKTKCWKRAYAGGKGYQHYISITNSGIDDVLRFNAFMPFFRPTGSRMIM